MSDLPLIIGITGYARTGKDSVGKMLVENHGYTRVAFADALKNLTLRINPFVVTQSPDGMRLQEVVRDLGWEDAKSIPEVRRLLQAVGVGVRELDPDIWVKQAVRMIDDLQLEAGGEAVPVVVTDVRFQNEVDALKKLGAVIWRTNRPGYGPANDHISETGVDHLEGIDNKLFGKDLRELELAVRAALLLQGVFSK